MELVDGEIRTRIEAEVLAKSNGTDVLDSEVRVGVGSCEVELGSTELEKFVCTDDIGNEIWDIAADSRD